MAFFHTLYSAHDFKEQQPAPAVHLWAKSPTVGSRTIQLDPEDFGRADELIEAAAWWDDTHDAYFHCALHQLGPENKRGSAGTARGICFLWMDLDYSEGKHANAKKYPPRSELLKVLGSGLPLRPSVLVDSGGGFHAYWLLSEEIEIEDDESRASASRLLRGWSNYVSGVLSANGWACDSTWDLARVLRVPGTTNTKNGKRVEVIQLCDELTYDESQFEEWRGEDPGPHDMGQSVELDSGLTLNRDATTPEMLIIGMKSVSVEFKKLWDRQRTDLAGDQSRYELGLATVLSHMGVVDQQILDLLVQHRRESGINVEKISRTDYFVGTLRKARVEGKRNEVLEDIGSIASGDMSASDDPAASPEIEQAAKLSKISTVMRVRVDRIERLPCDGGRGLYTFITEHGRMGPFTLLQIGTYRSFCGMVLDRFSVALPSDKASAKAWPDVVFLIRQVAIDVAADGGTLGEEGRQIVDDYLSDCTPHLWDESLAKQSAPRRPPFVWQGSVCITSTHLESWLRQARLDRLGRRELQARLIAAGWTNQRKLKLPKTPEDASSKARKTVSVWSQATSVALGSPETKALPPYT